MPHIDTKHFGRIEYQAESELRFPRGLPGFETFRRFVALHFAATAPLVYLQSIEDGAVCFLTAPVLSIEPSFAVSLDPEDLRLVGLPPESGPGDGPLWLAVLSVRESGPTANLLAPIVINPRTRRCVQAIAPESPYSHRQPLDGAAMGGCEPIEAEQALPC